MPLRSRMIPQRPNRSEGPCVFLKGIQALRATRPLGPARKLKTALARVWPSGRRLAGRFSHAAALNYINYGIALKAIVHARAELEVMSGPVGWKTRTKLRVS